MTDQTNGHLELLRDLLRLATRHGRTDEQAALSAAINALSPDTGDEEKPDPATVERYRAACDAMDEAHELSGTLADCITQLIQQRTELRAALKANPAAVSEAREAASAAFREAVRLADKSDKIDRVRMVGLAAITHLPVVLAALEANPVSLTEAGDDVRLDWLIANSLTVKHLGDTDQFMVVGMDGYPVTGGEYDTPREAIDDAINTQERNNG